MSGDGSGGTDRAGDRIAWARPRRVTMSSLARLAGVSAMTVSRALKADASVSAETRERVLKVVEETGYVPDVTARSFASGRSGFVAALIPSISNSNFADTTRGLADTLTQHGLELLLGFTDYSLQREEKQIATMLRRRPEGIVITGGVHTERARRMLEAARIPVVEIWDLPERPIGHVVGFSNRETARQMVSRLVADGYRRIGFIAGATDRDTRGGQRTDGYCDVLATHGLGPPRIVSMGEPPISMSHGAAAVVELLERWPDCDAVMCVSDLSAFGALMECHRRGWDVPGRLAIAGFGDFEVARIAHPRISTVEIDCVGIGRDAASVLARAFAARDAGLRHAPETIHSKFSIAVRGTS